MNRRRSFWKRLVLWARAAAFEEARKKRIMRENLETWNRYNRGFIKECERDDAAASARPSADASSTAGFYGSDSGD